MPKEHAALYQGKQIDNTSKILSLKPFLDENDLIRVAGRLRKSNPKFVEQRPILLLKNATLTKLLFEHRQQT